jgi:hypothetical protein
MTAVSDADHLIRRLRAAGIALEAKDDRIVWSAPPGVMTPEFLHELAATKPGVLASLRRDAQGWFPLAPAQEHLYVLERLAPGRAGLNIPAVVRIDGEIDDTALRLALNALVRRHDALRMIFDILGTSVVQRARPDVEVPLEIIDVANEDEAMRVLGEEAHRPFDLATGPTLRALIVRYAPSESLIQITFHHLSCDEYSLRLALGEVLALYAEYTLGQPAALTDSPRSYQSYVTEALAGTEDYEAGLRYWRENLFNLPPSNLPAQGPPYGAAIYADADAITALNALARSERSTLNRAIVTALALTLRGPLDRNDVVIGMPFNGRGAGYDATVGTFVNTLAIRSRALNAETFRELLSATGRDLLGALDHAFIPYHRVVDAVRPGGGLTELFDVWLVMREVQPALSIPGLSLTPIDVTRIATKHSLKLDLELGPDGLRGTLLGRSPTWKPATVERLAVEISTALTMVAEISDEPLTDALAAIKRNADQFLSRRRNEMAHSAHSRVLTTKRSQRG